jgi:hypothetical protein
MKPKRGKLPPKRFMTVLGGYTLDMHSQGCLMHPALIARVPGVDYGADPMGDGTFRMVPSGDIVDFAERTKRLQARP